ncbi:MAG: SlyX protein [Planctomycetota bacterium]|jgi:SlyX protein
MSAEQDARIALETKVMFLEDTVDALHEVVLAQGKSLELLNKRFEDMKTRLVAAADQEAEQRTLEDDRPPHY